MIDLLKLAIPFNNAFVVQLTTLDSGGVAYVDLEQCSLRGLSLEARNLEFHIDGTYEVSGLRHPFESLASYYTGLALKVRQGTRLAPWPYLEIKASPAKLLQGHNVFGTTDIELCAREMLYWLQTSLPDVFEMLDVIETRCDWIDCTFSAHLPGGFEMKQVIKALKFVQHGQLKPSEKRNMEHDTTAYFNSGSSHRELKIYSKFDELLNQIKEYEKRDKRKFGELIQSMKNGEIAEWSRNLLRFEGRAKQRFLEKHDVPRRLFDYFRGGKVRLGLISFQKQFEKETGQCLIEWLWGKMFSPLFVALEGSSMNVYSDEKVLDKLRVAYHRVTPKGNISYAKADRVFGFYRRLVNEGYQAVYQSKDRKTFGRHLKDLCDATGLSKAQLQNLSSERDNVIPLIRVINVDFAKQRPDWYQEPKSFFDENGNVVRFQGAA